MKKFTLLIASLFITIGAMAQTPVLELTSEQIGTSYPYELPDADAQKVYALTDLTVAVKVNTAAMSGRRALFCTADPTQAANTTAKGKDSYYVAYGTSGNATGYLASWKSGDQFTKSTVPANTDGVVLVYVINPSANTCKLYVNGTMLTSWVNAHTDGFMSGYEIATPGMVKNDYANAKIYIGGGVNSSGNSEVFNGTIVGVKVFDGALTDEQIANVFPTEFSEAVDELNAAIVNAETLLATITIGDGLGEYSGKYSASEVTDFLDNVKSFYANINENTSIESIVAYTELINETIASYSLNMPEAGRYYRIKGTSGNYIDASSIYNNATATIGQMSMKSDAECNLAGTIFYLDNDSRLLNYATGTYTRNTREIGTIGDATKSVWAFSESTRTRGKYVLTDNATSESKNLHDNNGTRADRCSSVCGERHDFVIEEVTTLPVTIKAAGYATLYAPVALTVPSEVKAYTVTINGEWATLNEITSGVIPAETGVIIAGANGEAATAGTYNFAITTSEETLESDLRGSAPATYYTEAGTYYALAQVNGEVGFYKDAFNNSRFQNNSHKAYLYIAEGSSTASYSFRFGEGTTGIDQITENREQSTVIYDLTGRKIENVTAPGIYIIGGKKVLVK